MTLNRCHVCDKLSLNSDHALCLTCDEAADTGVVCYDGDKGWVVVMGRVHALIDSMSVHALDCIRRLGEALGDQLVGKDVTGNDLADLCDEEIAARCA